MSQAPSTFGTMITSSLSPISPTSRSRSSSTHGESRLLTRVHSCVSPKSTLWPTFTSPSRAASLRSTGTASSRLPSRMSACLAMSGTFAAIFSLLASKKWIIREGRNGMSRIGSGAPTASGFAKSRGLRTGSLGLVGDYVDGRANRIDPRVNATHGRREDGTLRGHPYAFRTRRTVLTPMSETTNPVETDQAAREASGAHAYGRYLEEFEVGATYKHWPAKTVTESDDHLFCLITMNHHPLHLNDVYAAGSQQGRNVVVGPLVYSLALGMSVSDISGKAIANLATEELSHPNPVFHGDTLFCE